MCTAITYQTNHHYFGRNLDLEYSYHETVTVTPRNYPFAFRSGTKWEQHYAMIGMAYVREGYPLYYEATNEKGLSAAGLNFPGNAVYHPYTEGKENIAPFELIPWLLGQCATLEEARALLENCNLWQENFSEQLPSSPLHWIVADRTGALVVESMADGLHIHDDPVGVLTNNPPFSFHMHNLAQYQYLSRHPVENKLSAAVELPPFSRGMGAMGLPGDLSSASRFVRAAFTRLNAVCDGSEVQSVSQFFHILTSVEQQRGCVQMEDGSYEMTIYSSCCNTDTGVYYYTTYDHRAITAVDMHREDLEGETVIAYPLRKEQEIDYQN